MRCHLRWLFIICALSTLLMFDCCALAKAQENPDAPFPKSIQTIQSEEIKVSSADDPFRKPENPQPNPPGFDTSDPFGGSWSDVARSLREPVDFASLPGDALTKELSKLRTMRIDALQTQLAVLRAQLESQSEDRLMLLQKVALTSQDLSEAELEQELPSAEKQVSMRRAIDALRAWEKASFDRNETSKYDASNSLSAVCLRLKWEERLVKELIKQKTQPKPIPTVQSPVISSTPPQSIVVEPSSGYYYPYQPAYRNSRTYRSR